MTVRCRTRCRERYRARQPRRSHEIARALQASPSPSLDADAAGTDADQSHVLPLAGATARLRSLLDRAVDLPIQGVPRSRVR